jgi:hypothetical protein
MQLFSTTHLDLELFKLKFVGLGEDSTTQGQSVMTTDATTGVANKSTITRSQPLLMSNQRFKLHLSPLL